MRAVVCTADERAARCGVVLSCFVFTQSGTKCCKAMICICGTVCAADVDEPEA